MRAKSVLAYTVALCNVLASKYVSSNNLYAYMHIVLIFQCVCVASRLLWPLPIMPLLCYISFFCFPPRLKNISSVPLNVDALISLSLYISHALIFFFFSSSFQCVYLVGFVCVCVWFYFFCFGPEIFQAFARALR